MKKLRVGLFGVGHAHATPAIEALRAVEGVEIVGVCEPDDACLESKKSKHPPVYDGLRRMTERELFDAGLDAALVESVVPDLTPLAQRCVDAGLHVHMDKPAGVDLGAYKRVLDTAKAKGLCFHTGYMYRFNGGFREIIRQAKSGELGEIYNIYAQMCTEHRIEERERFASYGVGRPINYIFGCHLLDLILLLMGEPKHTASFGSRSGADGLDMEDTTTVILEYEKGQAVYRVSSVEINGPHMREFSVFGSKRTIAIRPLEPAVMTVADKGQYWSKAYTVSQPDRAVEAHLGRRYDLMMQDFVDIARGEKENEIPYEHEYLLQKILMRTCGETV